MVVETRYTTARSGDYEIRDGSFYRCGNPRFRSQCGFLSDYLEEKLNPDSGNFKVTPESAERLLTEATAEFMPNQKIQPIESFTSEMVASLLQRGYVLDSKSYGSVLRFHDQQDQNILYDFDYAHGELLRHDGDGSWGYTHGGPMSGNRKKL